MNSYTHILAAVDFSDVSELILQRSVELAEFYGANVSIVTVLEDMPVYPEPFGEFSVPSVDAEQWEGLKLSTKRQLDELKSRFDSKNLSYTEVLSGSPKIEITRYAEEHGVDLILLGSHGHRGVLAMLGSTTDGVTHRASCDVLSVRPEPE